MVYVSVVSSLYRCIQTCSKLISVSLQYWPAPPTIHRGLEWPQFLNCSLSVCLIVLWLSANFLSFLLLIILFYSTVSSVIYLFYMYRTKIMITKLSSIWEGVCDQSQCYEFCNPVKNKRCYVITGPLQIWPMVYILYIGINLAIIIKQYGDRKNSSGF